MAKYVLYGTEMSYFSGKARSYLRWKGVDLEERLADQEFYEHVCIPKIGRRVIPVTLLPDGSALQDTTELFDFFEQAHPCPSFSPANPQQRFLASLLELWADNWLLIPAMHYRWEYDAEVNCLDFGMDLFPLLPVQQQIAVGHKASTLFRGALPLLGVHPHNKERVERNWKAVLSELDAHFRQVPFLLGERPTIADFALTGALFAHMYRDATAGTLMKKEGLAVARYVEKMIAPRTVVSGDFPESLEVFPTLLPLLRRIMSEQIPVVVDAAERVSIWRQENPGAEIPRIMGTHSFVFEGATEDRAIFPYLLWMAERTKFLYEHFLAEEPELAGALVPRIGGEVLDALIIKDPVAMKNHEIVWRDEL
ncbi:MAG: glutathione S-transferase C-terminal domain-containing protein [Pseudomonadota bacterium]